MTVSSFVFLAGASRGVGREIATRLVQRGIRVKALLRHEASRPELEAMGVAIAPGDALNLTDLQHAMAGEPIDAVISTIGGLPQNGQRADYLGNKNLIDVAVQQGVSKFILVSSIGSGDSAVALPPQVLETLGAVLVEKHQAEQHLIASGLNYVIIRPGGLKSEPATGNGVLTPDPAIAGSIHRADVADLVCRCLVRSNADRQILSAVDRTMVYGASEFKVLSLEEV